LETEATVDVAAGLETEATVDVAAGLESGTTVVKSRNAGDFLRLDSDIGAVVTVPDRDPEVATVVGWMGLFILN